MKPLLNSVLLGFFTFALSACGDSKSPGTSNQEVGAASAAAPKCTPQLVQSDEVDTPAGKLSVTEFETADTAARSYVRASFMVQDSRLRLTEDEVKATLDHLSRRLASGCRANPIQQSILFLYPSGAVAGKSSAWIARQQTSGGAPEIDIRRILLKDERRNRFACLSGKEPGKDSGMGTRLPAQGSRTVIGTWADTNFGLTMSFERVGGKVYQVDRSAYCSSNDRGEPVRQLSPKRFAVIDSRTGDYYEIQPNGDLEVGDASGKIDIMPAHHNLFPATQPDARGL